MNVQILQEHIVKAVSRANRVIGSKSQIPILSHILFQAQNNTITLLATNLETTIKITVPGKIEEEGSFCLPAKLLNEFLLTLPKEQVFFTKEQESVVVKTTKTKTSIPGISATEFPPLPLIEGKTGVDISKESFLSALSVVLFSAATDETRPMLMGVRFEGGEGKTMVVATDGYRLSQTSVGETALIASQPLVIPARALAEVQRIGNEEKETTTIRITETIEGQLLFTIGDTQISTRRIDGEFPNYKKIIPATHKTSLLIDTEEFLRAVKSAAVFARDSAGIIKIVCSSESISVSANTPQVGENTIEIEGALSGEENTVAINSRFLLDLLGNVSGDQVTIELSGALSPVLFRFSNQEEFFHIIMPVRVQE